MITGRNLGAVPQGNGRGSISIEVIQNRRLNEHPLLKVTEEGIEKLVLKGLEMPTTKKDLLENIEPKHRPSASAALVLLVASGDVGTVRISERGKIIEETLGLTDEGFQRLQELSKNVA